MALVEAGHVTVLGITTNGQLWRAVRRPAGTWTQFVNDLNLPGGGSAPVACACARVDVSMHVAVAAADGVLWHTVQTARGWQVFRDVAHEAGRVGAFGRVAVAAAGYVLHLLAIADGKLWHTTRDRQGIWTPFFDVETKAGDRGTIVDCSCAYTDNELHVAAVTSDGRLWSARRRANGDWTPFSDVEARAGERGAFTRASIAVLPLGNSRQLFLSGVAGGKLVATTRPLTGSWTPFTDVEMKAGERGTFTACACTRAWNDVHVAGITTPGKLWHAIRRMNTTWIPFADIETKAGERGTFGAINLGST